MSILLFWRDQPLRFPVPERIWVDILDANGNVLGDGPLQPLEFRSTVRVNQVGSFSMRISPTEPSLDQLQVLRRVLAYTVIDQGGQYYVRGRKVIGGGVVRSIRKEIDDDGSITLVISGDDMLGELTMTTVGDLEMGSTSTTPFSTAVSIIMSYANHTWERNINGTFGDVYARFRSETVWSALRKVCQLVGANVYWAELGLVPEIWGQVAGRSIRFIADPLPTDLTLVGPAPGGIAESEEPAKRNIAYIERIEVVEDGDDLISRVIPYGSGQGKATLTLAATNRTPPPGYTLDAAQNYIKSDNAEATYGRVERAVSFREVGPITNSDADVQAAANALFDVALNYLKQYDQPRQSYRLTLASSPVIVPPFASIRVQYRGVVDGKKIVDVDQEMGVLEVTHVWKPGAAYTSDLVVSTSNLLERDEDALVSRIEQGRVFQAHPQLNANSYVIPWRGPVDETETATLYFRFGEEVVQLSSVVFDFQILPLESTVKSVGATSTTTTAGGGTTVTSASGGGTTVTSAGGSSHNHAVTLPDHSHNIPNHVHKISIANVSAGSGVAARIVQVGPNWYIAGENLGTTPLVDTWANSGATTSDAGGGTVVTSDAEASHTHTVTTPDHTHDVTIPDHTHDVTPNINTTYGIFRESTINTFNITDLEYQVNGGTWKDLSTATLLGGGWYRLDLSNVLMDASTFRPVASQNTLSIRRKSTGATGKTCMIDGQLSVRNIIQAIAYS